jgi:hypothetical protein
LQYARSELAGEARRWGSDYSWTCPAFVARLLAKIASFSGPAIA